MLNIIPSYITQEEQAILVSHFRKRVIVKTKERNSIVRYGSAIPYKARTNPIPTHFQFLLQRLSQDNIIDSDSITVNEYHPGQGIDWHVDSPSSGPKIVVLSLLSKAIMGIKGAPELHPILLPEAMIEKKVELSPLSLLVMHGEERWMCRHCIYPLDAHRYSIVFRKGV